MTTDGRFGRAVDRAIARENRAVVAKLCKRCAGTGFTYIPRNDGSGQHDRKVCQRCEGIGDRNPETP